MIGADPLSTAHPHARRSLSLLGHRRQIVNVPSRIPRDPPPAEIWPDAPLFVELGRARPTVTPFAPGLVEIRNSFRSMYDLATGIRARWLRPALAVAFGAWVFAGVSSTAAAQSETNVPEDDPPISESVRKPNSAIVFGFVEDVARHWIRPGFTRRVVDENITVTIESIAGRGEEYGSANDLAVGTRVEFVLRGTEASAPPVPFETVRPGGWYWFAVEPESNSTRHAMIAAREAPAPRFDIDRYFVRYRGEEGYALVIAELTRIERPEEHSGSLGRLDRYDFDRGYFGIERVIWHRPESGSSETRLGAIESDVARRAAAGSPPRPFIAAIGDGPMRTYLTEGRRYWLVLREGFYKVEAFLQHAIEIPVDREPHVLDLFEPFRGDRDHALVVARVVATTQAESRTGMFSRVPGERLTIEVLALPWESDRERSLSLSIGARLEVECFPELGVPGVPRFGPLPMGTDHRICIANLPDGKYPRIVETHPSEP
jgi:hypothetical protein